MIRVLGGCYEAVVLDLGAYRDSERLEEFLRADLPIVIGSGAEWRQHDLVTLARMLSRHPQPHRIYALPLAGEDSVYRVKRALETEKVVALPLQLDPFEMLEDSERTYAGICRDFIPTTGRKRKFLFRKK